MRFGFTRGAEAFNPTGRDISEVLMAAETIKFAAVIQADHDRVEADRAGIIAEDAAASVEIRNEAAVARANIAAGLVSRIAALEREHALALLAMETVQPLQ